MEICLYFYFWIAVIWFACSADYVWEIEDFFNAIFWPMIVLKYAIKWLINYFKTF